MSGSVDKKSDALGDESFLGRWSRRKRAEPAQRQDEDVKVESGVAAQRAADGAPQLPAQPAPHDPAAAPADLPNIDDLTPSSDYRRFMQPDVPRASRNAAMKKLFTDPHFNVMDGLDIYIDDYTKEDPIPLEMLKDLAQSRMLKLFDADEEKDADKEKSTDAAAETVVAQGSQKVLPQESLQEPVSGPLQVQESAGAGNFINTGANPHPASAGATPAIPSLSCAPSAPSV